MLLSSMLVPLGHFWVETWFLFLRLLRINGRWNILIGRRPLRIQLYNVFTHGTQASGKICSRITRPTQLSNDHLCLKNHHSLLYEYYFSFSFSLSIIHFTCFFSDLLEAPNYKLHTFGKLYRLAGFLPISNIRSLSIMGPLSRPLFKILRVS